MAARLSLIFSLICLSFGLYAQEKLTLLTYQNPPLVQIDDGTISGTSWKVVQKILDQTKTSYELLIKPPVRGLFHVEVTENSCVFPIDRTQQRESKYSWIGPVAINRYALYSAPGREIPLITLADAKNYNIATYLGSSIGGYLKRRGFHVRLTGEMKQGLLMLKHRRVDFWVVDINAAKQVSEKLNIELGEPELIFFTSVNYMACHPTMPSKQLKQMNRVLDEMYVSGDIHQFLGIDL